MSDVTEIRNDIRRRRLSLDHVEVSRLSKCIAEHVKRSDIIQPMQHVACYLSIKNEPSCSDIISLMWHKDCQVYLPVIDQPESGHMQFADYHSESLLKPNRFHIDEPVSPKHVVLPEALDIIFLPLVAFDDSGNRLGNGAGYYDKTLAACRYSKKPLRIGVAYSFQQVEHLEKKPWDVELHGVVTEKGVNWFKSCDD